MHRSLTVVVETGLLLRRRLIRLLLTLCFVISE